MDKNDNPKYFYDTCSLLNYADSIFSGSNRFAISEWTLKELESIKTSSYKDKEIKYKARNVTRHLIDNHDLYDVVITTDEIFDMIETLELEENIDSCIIMSATYFYQTVSPITFVTDDLCLYNLAQNLTPIHVSLGCEIFGNIQNNAYKGYKEIQASEEELAYLYEHLSENIYKNLINEYLIVKDCNGKVLDKLKWNGFEYKALSYKQIRSIKFGILKPLDVYQECAFDSIHSNDITVLTGRAGAGKTTIPLNYFAKNLETEKIKKLYVVYHFEPLKGARTLGYEKGDHLSKLLNTGSLSGILSSKFGDITAVERMIQDNRLEIIPTANIRGIEFGSDTGLLVTEAQDIDNYTLKTIIQRCKDGCKQVYEGDIFEQNDLLDKQSGIYRMVDVFKGNQRFGYVNLKNNYRSELCTLADKM